MLDNSLSEIEPISLRVKKLLQEEALIINLNSNSNFFLPLNLLPKNTKKGDRITLKILNFTDKEEHRQKSAQRLLEEIIN